MIRLYYTGATSNLVEQRLSVKSLGGFVSSSPVENAASEAFFSDLSQTSITQDLPEYRLFALKNEGVTDINNLMLFYQYKEANPSINICFSSIKPSMVDVDGNCQSIFEKINNGNSAPIFSQNWYEADSKFPSQQVFLSTAARMGEVITFLGVETRAAVSDLSLTNTYKLIVNAFKNNQDYLVQYVSRTDTETNLTTGDQREVFTEYIFVQKNVIRENTDPITFTTTGQATLKQPYFFQGGYDNSINIGTVKAGQYLGIWFKKSLNIDVILN